MAALRQVKNDSKPYDRPWSERTALKEIVSLLFDGYHIVRAQGCRYYDWGRVVLQHKVSLTILTVTWSDVWYSIERNGIVVKREYKNKKRE